MAKKNVEGSTQVNVKKLTLKAQDASFLLDMIGLCETPLELYQFGLGIDEFIKPVNEYTAKFNKKGEEYKTSAQAIFDRYFIVTPATDGNAGKQELIEGMTKEDYMNELKGLSDEFLIKTDKFKTEDITVEIEELIFENFLEIFNFLDIKSASAKDEKPEIYTAIVYNLSKILNGGV